MSFFIYLFEFHDFRYFYGFRGFCDVRDFCEGCDFYDFQFSMIHVIFAFVCGNVTTNINLAFTHNDKTKQISWTRQLPELWLVS